MAKDALYEQERSEFGLVGHGEDAGGRAPEHENEGDPMLCRQAGQLAALGNKICLETDLFFGMGFLKGIGSAHGELE